MPIPFEPALIGTVPLHAAMVAVLLFVVTVPIALRLARHEGRPWLVPMLLGSLALHLAGAVLQIFVVRYAYENIADFHLYDGQGARLAEAWRDGIGTIPGLDLPGNGAVSIAVGVVYSAVGIDQLGGFFVFSWFSFLGLLAFYRAFRIALPMAQSARYAVLIFLLPSLFYWPSAAGKEALMLLALGVLALGSARLLRGQWRGAVPMIAGAALGAAVRPHEVALVFGAFGVALVIRRVTNRSLLTPVRRVATILSLVVVGGLLARFTAQFLGISSFSAAAVVQAVNDANLATQGEGSGFESSHDIWHGSPLYYPVDIYLVLFKPLPFEVATPTQAIAALENLTLIVLFAVCWRSLVRIPGQLKESPFVVLCLVYSLVFVYLFSALGNEGLLVRERTLLFPFLFVLFALPAPAPRRDLGGAPRVDARHGSSSSDLL
jgi:hypothetical protein